MAYGSTGRGAPVQVHWGVFLEMPLAPVLGEAGHFYYVIPTSPTNGDQLWMTDVEGGVLIWKLIGGIGAPSSVLAMKYFVNNSAGGNPQPSCLYSTIAAAQAAFLADGHNALNPAVIWLCPTNSFPENVTFSPGMSIKGMVDDYHFNNSLTVPTDNLPQITGIVDLGSGDCSLSYCRVVGSVKNAVSAGPVSQVLDNVEIISGDANTPLDILNPNSHLFMHRVSVVGPELGGTPSMRSTVAALVHAVDVDIRVGGATSNIVLDLFDVGSYFFRNSNFVGRLSVDAAVASFDHCDILSTVSSPFEVANAATVRLFGKSRVTSAAATMVTDNGGAASTIVITDTDFPTTAGTLPAFLVTTTVITTIRPVKVVPIAPNGTVATLDEAFTMDATAGDCTFQLLSLTLVPLGYECSIKKISLGNKVTILPAGLELIDGGNTYALTAGAGRMSAVRLRAATTMWHIIAAYNS